MAYMNQPMKKVIMNNLKEAGYTAKNGWSLSFKVNHHSTLQVTIRKAPFDMITEFVNENESYKKRFPNPLKQVNVNHYHLCNLTDSRSKTHIEKITEICNKGNHDNSDVQTDFFDVGWYYDLTIGDYITSFEVHSKFLGT